MTIPKKRVLLVQDEDESLGSLAELLTSKGYDLQRAAGSQSGHERAFRESFDLLLLDIKHGLDVCQSLRRKDSRVCILMLTAPGQLDDRVQGLKLGADDCLAKPFEPVELLARVEAVMRRASSVAPCTDGPVTYEFDRIHVDFVRHQVWKDRTPLLMLPLEYKLLRYFIQHQDVILTRHRLLEDVWGYDQAPTTRTVDVHVAGIRQKIEVDARRPRHLLTIHRRGYKFVG